MDQEKEKTQVTSIRNERVSKAADIVVFKRLCKRRMWITLCQYIRHLNEVDKFLERPKVPVLIQENMNSLNNLTSVKEIEFPQRNSGPRWLPWWILANIFGGHNTEFTQILPLSWRESFLTHSTTIVLS